MSDSKQIQASKAGKVNTVPRFGKGVLITLLSRGVALPIGILSSIVTARYLGPSGRGILAILIALQGLALQLGTFGFNASIVYFVSGSAERAPRIITISILMAASAGVLASVALLVVCHLAPSTFLGSVDVRYLYVFILAVPFAFFQQFLQNILLAKHRILEFNLLDLGSRVLQLTGFSVVLIVLGGSTMEAIICLVIVTLLSGVVYLFRVIPSADRSFPIDWKTWREMMRYGSRNYTASLIMFLSIRINLFVVNGLLGEAASGQYSVVMQLADLLYLLPITLGTMLFPRISSHPAGDSILTTTTLRFANIAMIGIGIVLFLFGERLILILYGNEFLPAVSALYWHIPGIVALSLVMILNNDLAGRGLPSVVIWAPAIGLIVNCIIIALAVPAFGIAGASIASSVCSLVILCFLLWHFVRRFKLSLWQIFLPNKKDIRLFGIQS